ncbi:MAG TPA: oligosaccharide flippase family protein [Patescibacteria group bacterium]|nr:oligosaccharide flippase family protein [Patescibacteria group bacterium]
MHKQVAKNTFYQALGKIATSGTGFIITILLAREYGVLGYGDFVKITTYVAFFYLSLDFGLNAIFLQEKNTKNYKYLFTLRLAIALLILVLSNLIAFFLPYNKSLDIGYSSFVRLGIFVFSFSYFSQAVILSCTAIFQKTLNYYSYFKAIFAGSLLNLTLIGIFVSFKMPLLYIIISFVISGIVTSLISIVLIYEKKLFAFNFKYVKKLIITSSPIAIMLIFNLIYFRADIFLLSVLKSTKDVGVYGLSYRFFEFLIALPLFLSNSLYPFLLKDKNNLRKFYTLVRQYFLIFSLIGILLVIPFWFISPLFTLIKSEFSLAIVPFRILLLSLPLFFVTSLLQWTLIAQSKQKFLMKAYLFSAIINIVLNIIFIPKGSYIASAIITGVSEFIIMVVLIIKVFNLKILLEREYESKSN